MQIAFTKLLKLKAKNMFFTNKIKLIVCIGLLIVFCSACGGETAANKNESAASTQQKTATTTPAKNTAAPSNPVNAGKVTISGKAVTAKSGEDFCMDVQVANFVDVVSMQYSTNWDEKALLYKGVKNPALKDLSKDNFGRAKTEAGTLRLSWYAQDLKGVTLYDGSTVYQVCFTATGKSGTTTAVKFESQPMAAEIANSKMQILPVELKTVAVVIK